MSREAASAPLRAGGSSAITRSRRTSARAAASRALTWSPRDSRTSASASSARQRVGVARHAGLADHVDQRRLGVVESTEERPALGLDALRLDREDTILARGRAQAGGGLECVPGPPRQDRQIAQARERMHGLLRALARHLYRLFEVAPRAIEIARLEQIIAHIAERIRDPERGAKPPRQAELLLVQDPRLGPGSALGMDPTKHVEGIHRPLQMTELSRDRESRRALAKRRAVRARLHPEVGHAAAHEGLVASRLEHERDGERPLERRAPTAHLVAPGPRGAEPYQRSDLPAPLPRRGELGQRLLDRRDGGADVAGEPQVHREHLERSPLPRRVVELTEQRQRRFQLAAALGHPHEIQEHHAELGAGACERLARARGCEHVHRPAGQLEPTRVVLMAAPPRAEVGEHVALRHCVAVLLGERQRRLEIGARRLEAAKSGVHVGARLEHDAARRGGQPCALRGEHRLVVARERLPVRPGPVGGLGRPARVLGRIGPGLGREIVVGEQRM